MNIVSGYIGNMYVNTKPLKKCHVTIKDVFMFCQKVLIIECPRLNITVKKVLKDLGGKIITQSGMAKDPDETNGFRQGWTTRQSLWTIKHINDTIDGQTLHDRNTVRT